MITTSNKHILTEMIFTWQWREFKLGKLPFGNKSSNDCKVGKQWKVDVKFLVICSYDLAILKVESKDEIICTITKCAF